MSFESFSPSPESEESEHQPESKVESENTDDRSELTDPFDVVNNSPEEVGTDQVSFGSSYDKSNKKYNEDRVSNNVEWDDSATEESGYETQEKTSLSSEADRSDLLHKTEKNTAEDLVSSLREVGVESEVVHIPGSKEFSEIVVLSKPEMIAEKKVRLYRGVNNLDAEMLKQIPYAMRVETETGRPVVVEDVEREVEKLAENPTYENFLDYLDKIWTHLSDDEKRRITDWYIPDIETSIMKGWSMRDILASQQVRHLGGLFGDSGITPYLSASYDPLEAAGYGEALLIIDVPPSEVQDYRSSNSETNIKGKLDPNHITAVLLRGKKRQPGETEERREDIERALNRLSELSEVSVYQDQELSELRQQKSFEEKRWDQEQQKRDLEFLSYKRARDLVQVFSELQINLEKESQEAKENGENVYTKLQRDIFEFYHDRFRKIGLRMGDLSSYEFVAGEEDRLLFTQKDSFTDRKNFNKEEITDNMLVKLREFVLHNEKRKQERDENRSKGD